MRSFHARVYEASFLILQYALWHSLVDAFRSCRSRALYLEVTRYVHSSRLCLLHRCPIYSPLSPIPSVMPFVATQDATPSCMPHTMRCKYTRPCCSGPAFLARLYWLSVQSCCDCTYHSGLTYTVHRSSEFRPNTTSTRRCALRVTGPNPSSRRRLCARSVQLAQDNFSC